MISPSRTVSPWAASFAALAGAVITLAAAPEAFAQTRNPARAPIAQAAAIGSAEESVTYQVKPGDTLYDLADYALINPQDYRHIQRLNRVRDPRRLQIGASLVFPVRLLRTTTAEGTVSSFRGTVAMEDNGRAATLQPGRILSEGAVLSTGPNSFIRLAFSDGSHVVVPSNSRVRLSRLRRYILTGTVDQEMTVETGRAEASVRPVRRPGGFSIRTPLSVAAVRGTEFRAAYDADAGRAATEVLQGVVAVDTPADTNAVEVAAGQGAAADVSGDLRIAVLPEAPNLSRPDRVQTGPQLEFPIVARGDIARVRGRLATDAGMIDAFAEADSAGQGADLIFPDLPDGAYFLRLTALTADGLEGKSVTYDVLRARNGLKNLLASITGQGRQRSFLFKWEAEGDGAAAYRFQLWREGAEQTPLIDQANLSEPQMVLTGLRPGVYEWRARITRQKFGRTLEAWSEPQQLRIGR